MRALSIAVTSSVLGTSLVGRVFRHTTISVHLNEVHSTVQTTGQLGHVNVEGELLVEKVEHLVPLVGVHEVDTRANVLAVRVAGDELQSESIAAGGDTVGGRVLSTLKLAVLRVNDQ